MRLLKVWTAVLALSAIVSMIGCGGSNMNPAGGKMDDKTMSDGNMMSPGKMAPDGNKMSDNTMDGKMSSDNKMSGGTK